MKLIVQLVAVAVVALVGSQGVASVQEDHPYLALAVGLLTAVVAVLVYGATVRWTERRTVTEIAPRSAARGLAIGTLIGVAVFGAVIANIAFLGDYKVHGWGSGATAAGLVGFMAGAAATEELLFRGVLFRKFEERTGTWIAMLLSSVLFGASHLANPDASLWGAVCVAVEAGGMLTAAYIATRKLWIPIGLHFGWNFAASGIFSTVVSGNGSNKGLLDATMSGPAAITGGKFGPEGSLYAMVFCVLVALAYLWLARRRGHIVPRGGRVEDIAAVATLSR